MQGYGEYTLFMKKEKHAFVTQEYAAMKPGECWREGALWLCRYEIARLFPIAKETTNIIMRVTEFASPGAIHYQEDSCDCLVRLSKPDWGLATEVLSVSSYVLKTLPKVGWVTVEEA